jgi:hypothetical protein
MNKFIDFLYVIAESPLPIEQKINIVKQIVEDITSYAIGSDKNIEMHLETIIQILKENKFEIRDKINSVKND